MQQTIDWSPESICTIGLSWETKLYYFYLLVVTAISVIRAFRLLQQIGFLPSFKKGGKTVTADSLAADALSDRLPKKLPQDSTLVTEAEKKIDYLWEISSLKIEELKKLVALNLLLGILVVLLLSARVANQIVVEKTIGTFAVLGIFSGVLTPFTFGVLISSVLYAFCVVYEGVALRRRASWKYFSSQI